MILAEEMNIIGNYLDMGFDKRLSKQTDEFYSGVNRTDDYKSSLEMDSSFEGFDVGKLQTNQLKQSINLGNVKIDGVNNKIVVSDGRLDQILIGYDRGGF